MRLPPPSLVRAGRDLLGVSCNVRHALLVYCSLLVFSCIVCEGHHNHKLDLFTCLGYCFRLLCLRRLALDRAPRGSRGRN